MLLFKTENLKSQIINIVLLICGIFSFIIFFSITNGIEAWKWVLIVEEPDEWFIFVYPSLISIIFVVFLLKEIKQNK